MSAGIADQKEGIFSRKESQARARSLYYSIILLIFFLWLINGGSGIFKTRDDLVEGNDLAQVSKGTQGP